MDPVPQTEAGIRGPEGRRREDRSTSPSGPMVISSNRPPLRFY